MAGTHSGVGKTTVATGIMAALRARGRQVGAAKVGPDYIDPGYHGLATGRPSRNLDPWMCGPHTTVPVAAAAARGCDVLVVEGVMGLFDGASTDLLMAGDATVMPSSTAHVAQLLRAPVVLVVDAAAMSGSVAALVHGFGTFDASLDVAGVILNRVASDAHERDLRAALASQGTPVVGVLRRDERFRWRDRHLGLVPVVERGPELRDSIERLASAVTAGCDLDRLEQIADGAERLAAPLLARASARHGSPPRVAVAGGPAFSFYYPDNLEALRDAGAELVELDPLRDTHLPPGIDGLVAGGGFPEVYAGDLAGNTSLLEDVRRRVGDGLVTWAECGGLLWLSQSLDGRPMAAALTCQAHMTDRLTLGYRTARLGSASPLGPPGISLRGHEFHYSSVDPPGAALTLKGRTGISVGGFATPTLFASYLHQHLAGKPRLAEHFVESCAHRSAGRHERRI